MFASLDTKTQRPGFCLTLPGVQVGVKAPSRPTSYSHEPNSWRLAQGPNQGGLKWLVTATGGAVGRMRHPHRGPSLPTRPPPPEVCSYPVMSRAHVCLALHT